jgi:hypothetical protein
MKLWRARNGVTWDKSLALELMTIDALSGSWTTDLGQQLMAVFQYVYDRIEQVRLVDPANSNNVVSDELTPAHRANIKHWAKVALDARTWGEIFRA